MGPKQHGEATRDFVRDSTSGAGRAGQVGEIRRIQD